ncbi:hypothetical protein M436DRAFT_44896 [Aureobasidium namibiae CBS 147.97]|uniref:BTB domain-containing protein n=1 Tax=Aureobasidium namibiae CBS 147.97 TaxID=1043004 RepID=A0A074WR32_9PEZI|nr:uncharacterized protein M436DRAFT_44896 [Aureobasidium namibiae CBS 147.97]KEQ74064.1 hypothetical protein M436DRAFT_44896 [Aureobasidium namibiae CBS 147.97]
MGPRHYVPAEDFTDYPPRAAVAGPTAKVVVGSGANAKPFYVHKQLLCDSSTYFTTALNDGFAETKHQTIKLDDEDPDIFLTYVLWLYGGKLSREALPSDQTEGPFENHLFKLYVFADKRGVKNLANNTITMLAAHWVQKCVTMSEVAWVVLLLSPNDKLYELIQDHLILELREEILDEPKHLLAAMDLPKEFLFNLLRRSGKLGKQFERAHHCFEAVCHYHCHQGPGIVSREDCILSIEAGDNIYDNCERLEDIEQCAWKGNVSQGH